MENIFILFSIWEYEYDERKPCHLYINQTLNPYQWRI